MDNLAPASSSIFVQVTSTPSSSKDTVRTEVWTSADKTATLNATAEPLIIYASVSDEAMEKRSIQLVLSFHRFVPIPYSLRISCRV